VDPATVETAENENRARTSLWHALEQPDKDARAAALETLVGTASRDMESLRKAWSECDGMLYHDQWGRYDDATRQWAPRGPAPSNKIVRLDLNHIHPLVQHAVSIHTAEPLNIGCAAATSELSDREAAKTADAILWHYYERLDGEALRQEQAELSICQGTAYVYPYWNPGAGRIEERVEFAGEPSFDEAGNFVPPEIRRIPLPPAGELGMAIYSGFEVTWDPAATTRDPGMWCDIATEVSLDEVLSDPTIAQDVKDRLTSVQPTAQDGLEYQQRRQAMHPRSSDPHGFGPPAVGKTSRETLILHRTFVRATGQFPRGLEILHAQGVELYSGDNPKFPPAGPLGKGQPWPDWPFPVYPFRNYVVPGTWHGQGDVVRVIAPQKALNGAVSKELMIVRRVAHATLVVPKGVNFHRTDEVDQQIEVPTTLQPNQVFYLNGPQAPQGLVDFERRQRETMEYLFGLNAATLGRLPSSEIPAKGIQQLQQRDIGRRQPIQNRWTRQWSKVWGHALELIRRHVTDERLITIVGANKRASAMVFTGSKIAAGTDVVVFDDYARPRDPAMRIVWMKSMFEMGLLDPTNPVERGEARELMGLASMNRFDESLRSDREKQTREILALYRGEPQLVEFWENDNDHLAVLTVEMNSEQYATATTPQPGDQMQQIAQKQAVKAVFEEHFRGHLEMRQFKSAFGMLAAAQQAQAQQPAGAMGPGAATPPAGAPAPGGAPAPPAGPPAAPPPVQAPAGGMAA